MKAYYPSQIIGLRFQVDFVTPKKIRLFEKYYESPTNPCLFNTLVIHRLIKTISGGKKLVE